MRQHRLTNINGGTATCAVCGPDTLVRVHGTKTKCDNKVREKIATQEMMRKERDRSFRYPHRKIVKERLEEMICERCGFVAEDLCQLDVDHVIRRVDGGDDSPENLMVLCANCHRLKTKAESKIATLV